MAPHALAPSACTGEAWLTHFCGAPARNTVQHGATFWRNWQNEPERGPGTRGRQGLSGVARPLYLWIPLIQAPTETCMAVKLRLKRMGRSNAAFYRLNAI